MQKPDVLHYLGILFILYGIGGIVAIIALHKGQKWWRVLALGILGICFVTIAAMIKFGFWYMAQPIAVVAGLALGVEYQSHYFYPFEFLVWLLIVGYIVWCANEYELK